MEADSHTLTKANDHPTLFYVPSFCRRVMVVQSRWLTINQRAEDLADFARYRLCLY